jgi:hypothetical protein
MLFGHHELNYMCIKGGFLEALMLIKYVKRVIVYYNWLMSTNKLAIENYEVDVQITMLKS